MAFCQFHWFSQILGRQTTTWLLLPDGGKPPFAAFYLLHGLSDDHTMWLRRSRIEMYASGLPLIIVMPDAGRGYYTNHASGPQWATHLGEELPGMIERTFPAKTTREGRCVGGLSMGGYGAMRLALGYPDRFISANSHSGALQGPKVNRSTPYEFEQMIGGDYAGSGHDLVTLVKKAKRRKLLPQLRIDCGTADFLLEDNRKFHQSLNQLNIKHEYEEFPGEHNWDYWDLHIRQALKFHAKALFI